MEVFFKNIYLFGCSGSLVAAHETFFFFGKTFIYLFIYLFIYFWLWSVFVVGRAFFLVAVLRLRIEIASLVVTCGLQAAWASVVVASGLYGTGSVAVAHSLSCAMACGVFPDQGLTPCLLHWQADSLPLSHQGSPSLSWGMLTLGCRGIEFSHQGSDLAPCIGSIEF